MSVSKIVQRALAAEARILALENELAECRDSRQREHDLRVTMAGELESFKIRYQDEVNARVDAENDRDALRTGYVSELRKAKADLQSTAEARILAPVVNNLGDRNEQGTD